MNRLESMQIYLRVAELASFTQAADSLGLPKASVSAAVQNLESLLGTRLLHRTTRRVQMTQDGQAFYERCKDVLADIDEMQGMFRPHGEALVGRLRVDMPLAVAHTLVVPRLGEFLAAHPQIEIELSSTDRRVDLIREGFDCVLRVGSLADSSLIARPLGRYRMTNCASPAYLAANGTPHSLADLAAHRLVHYVSTLGGKPDGFEYVDDISGEVRRVEMAGAVTVNNSEAYQAACLGGLGLIQAPRAGVSHWIENGALLEVLPQFRAPPLLVSLVYPNRRHLPKRVQAFMDWLAQLVQPRLDPL